MYNTDKLRRFMPDAQSISNHSKDSSTKVGALILGPGYEIRSSGWNGAPRGCSADEDWRFEKRPEKYMWSSHAEANAITNAARVGTPLEGCALLVTHFPCMGCAKLIVQSGVTLVICPEPDADFTSRWSEDIERAKSLLTECGVTLIIF